MSEQASAKKNNLLKIVMIPVLGVALYWVVTKNQKSDSTPVANFEQSKQATGKESASAKLASREIQWPDLAIDDLLQHNPFNTGIQIPNSSKLVAEKGIANPSVPQQIEISIYMDSAKGPVAMIDGQIVHEGDQLANGQFITKLTPQYALLGGKL